MTAYDALGRPTIRASTNPAGGGLSSEIVTNTWVYDPVGNPGALQYQLRRRGSGLPIVWREDYAYDTTTKRLSTTTTTIGSTVLPTQHQYDTLGRPNNTIYPSGLQAKKEYNAAGYYYRLLNGFKSAVYRTATSQRYREVRGSGETILFGPGGFELVTAGGVTTYRHELGPIVVNTVGGTNTERYVLRDRLGSAAALSPPDQSISERRAYDPYGKVRNGDFTDFGAGQLQLSATMFRGFTSHEHLDNLQLIHMNGCLFDYHIEKMLVSTDDLRQHTPSPVEQSNG